jgi:alpha-glucosidase
MLGDAILVAPVVEPGSTTRSVDLPKGADWRCGWSGETFAGGQTVLRPAPYAEPPFFVRAGLEIGLTP